LQPNSPSWVACPASSQREAVRARCWRNGWSISPGHLQPFEDGNKRTSSLAANIPLMRYRVTMDATEAWIAAGRPA
jgi:hypothetical protein